MYVKTHDTKTNYIILCENVGLIEINIICVITKGRSGNFYLYAPFNT